MRVRSGVGVGDGSGGGGWCEVRCLMCLSGQLISEHVPMD